jgi:hypothetical protein
MERQDIKKALKTDEAIKPVRKTKIQKFFDFRTIREKIMLYADIEYLKLLAILTIPMLFLCLYSFCDKEFGWNEFVVQKTKIASYFVVFGTSETNEIDETQKTSENKSVASDTVVRDTCSQRILFFGDSMLEGLSKRLKQYASENNHDLMNVIWYSSSTKIWGQRADTIAHFIRDFKPTYIFVCLGANELFVRNPENNDAYVKQILSQIGNIPYIWIGPPNWKEDTGINDLIQKNVAPNCFFASDQLTYERASDGAHPTFSSAAKWMDSIAIWMNDRILMDFPQDDQSKGLTILLKPLK